MSSTLFNQSTQAQMPQINNQQMQMIKSMLSKNGMSAEQMVRQVCQQRGIDVDAFMKQFR